MKLCLRVRSSSRQCLKKCILLQCRSRVSISIRMSMSSTAVLSVIHRYTHERQCTWLEGCSRCALFTDSLPLHTKARGPLAWSKPLRSLELAVCGEVVTACRVEDPGRTSGSCFCFSCAQEAAVSRNLLRAGRTFLVSKRLNTARSCGWNAAENTRACQRNEREPRFRGIVRVAKRSGVRMSLGRQPRREDDLRAGSPVA